MGSVSIVVSWDTDFNNSAGLCVTQNTGEALCRLAGFSWNYGTMSCQYCAGATEDLIGWSSMGERVCKAPPYVSVELGYYHSCAKLRKKGGLPSVECWGGIDGAGAVPVNETATDTNEGRTMRTEVTNKDDKKSGHLVPDDQDVIEFQRNLTNHVKTTSPIVSLAVGAYASCAIVENTLQCWGRSDFVGGTNVSKSWVKQVRDLTPNLASTSGYTLKSPDKLLLKKVVVSKTDPTAVIPPSTSVKDKEVFCLLADDYSSFGASNSITSVIYCWGNPIGNIPNLTVGQQYPSPVSVFTANNFRILNLFVNETNLSYLTNSSSRPLSFLGGASTNVLGTVQPTALTSYSNSGFVACVLKDSTPHCVGMQGYDSGNFRYNESNQMTFLQVPWDPTVMLGTNLFNSFNYDFPENPETISLTTGQQTQTAITGGAVAARYTQTARGTATKAATGLLSSYTYTATAVSPRSINSTLPVTDSPKFSKVVTLRTSACGLDISGNVWCWGACKDTSSTSTLFHPGGGRILSVS